MPFFGPSEWVSVLGGPEQLQVSHYHTFGADAAAMSRRLDHADLDGDTSTSDYVDLYLHRDHLGSVQELTLGSTGAIVESYRYDAYGTPTIQAGPTVPGFSPPWNAFLYTGREYDFETDLYHFRARTYDPTVGAFLQEDPIGYADGLNPVAYVAGNPISLTDPWGTSAIGDAFEDLSDMIDRNRDLIGGAAALISDILSPLAGIIDAISAAIGKDVGGWISGGFRGEMKDLGWWARVKKGAGAALSVAGGAVAVLTKFKKIRKRLNDLFDNLRKPSPPQCFVAGTLVLMASGDLIPIEEIQVGDRVADTGLRLMEEEVPPGEYLAVSGDVVAGVGVGTWLETLVPAEAAATEELIGSRFLIELSSNEVRGLVEVDATRPVTITEGEGCVVQTKTRRVANELVRVVFEGGEEIVGTPEHPLLVAGERERAAQPEAWLRMGELSRGSKIECRIGSGLVTANHWTQSSEELVWNLEVDQAASFYLLKEGYLCHNDHGVRRGQALQSGGHTIKPGTAKKLGMSKGEAKQAIEDLKLDHGLPNNHKGKFWPDGEYTHADGTIIEGRPNLLDYKP